ncbi:hypothetical protein AL01_05010 [Bombella intestini]|uniref:Uncharacterized protein n=1 Tax=Bombella intestini TaxID=1539051 RepID=A0A1S8GR09_9PROT|nr:hypothetical protein AL01_05010 [Bombella intestini]
MVGAAFQTIQDQQDRDHMAKRLLPAADGSFSALEIGRDLLEASGAAGVGTLSGNVIAAVTRD